MDAPGLTTLRIVRAGERRGQGTDGTYYCLAYGPGEPTVRRLELATGAAASTAATHRRTSLLRFAYLTDFHILDAESPGRFEFVERFHGQGHAALHLLLPAYRPHEFLQLHACEAMIRTLNAIADSPLTGAPLQLVLCAGDHTDNAQVNELGWVTDLFAGRSHSRSERRGHGRGERSAARIGAGAGSAAASLSQRDPVGERPHPP